MTLHRFPHPPQQVRRVPTRETTLSDLPNVKIERPRIIEGAPLRTQDGVTPRATGTNENPPAYDCPANAQRFGKGPPNAAGRHVHNSPSMKSRRLLAAGNGQHPGRRA